MTSIANRICETSGCKHFRSDHRSGGKCGLCDCEQFAFTDVKKSKAREARHYTDEEAQQCLDMLKSGYTYTEVGKATGRSRVSVRAKFPGYSRSERQLELDRENRRQLLAMWEGSEERAKARKRTKEERLKAAGYTPRNLYEEANRREG